jgi:arginase
LRWDELQAVPGATIATGAVVGIEITIFNPTLDPDGSIARALVTCLSRALVPGDRSAMAGDADPPTRRRST